MAGAPCQDGGPQAPKDVPFWLVATETASWWSTEEKCLAERSKPTQEQQGSLQCPTCERDGSGVLGDWVLMSQR